MLSREGQSCETKPILQLRIADSRQTCGRDTPPFQYSIIPLFRPDANRAKQTQTWAGWDIWGTMHRGSQSCNTKPISGVRTGEPRGRLYKQSQFRRRIRRGKCSWEKELWLIVHATRLGETKPIHSRQSCRRDQSRKTNPIPAARAQVRETKPIRTAVVRDGATGAWDEGAIARNKANLHPGKRLGGANGTPNAICRVWEPDPPYERTSLRQTNPIRPGPRWGEMGKTNRISESRPVGKTIGKLRGLRLPLPPGGTTLWHRHPADGSWAGSGPPTRNRALGTPAMPRRLGASWRLVLGGVVTIMADGQIGGFHW